jgi:hypothetical protein
MPAMPRKATSTIAKAPAPRVNLAEKVELVKVCYVGFGGSGKTTDAASLARLGNVVAVDAEGGIKRRPLIERGIPVANIELHSEITYDALDALFWELKARLHDEPGSIVGVTWDSTSETHKKLLEQEVELQYEKQVAKGNPKDRARFDTWVDDYGTNTGQMRYLLRRFMDLPVHVAFVTLPRRDQDEEDATVKYGPDLTPKLQQDLIGFVDIVCHTFVVENKDGEDEFWGDFSPSGKWFAKDRFGALPKHLINPTMDRIIAYVNDEIDVESDPDMQAARERRQAARVAARTDDGPETTADSPTTDSSGPLAPPAPTKSVPVKKVAPQRISR